MTTHAQPDQGPIRTPQKPPDDLYGDDDFDKSLIGSHGAQDYEQQNESPMAKQLREEKENRQRMLQTSVSTTPVSTRPEMPLVRPKSKGNSDADFHFGTIPARATSDPTKHAPISFTPLNHETRQHSYIKAIKTSKDHKLVSQSGVADTVTADASAAGNETKQSPVKQTDDSAMDE
jgi:hypothetical protein